MAVYERTYRAYAGPLTPQRGRFLVLPRYAAGSVFQSRLFVAFLVCCFLNPLGYAILIYLPHNLSFLRVFQLETGELFKLLRYDAGFFMRFLAWQGWMAFLCAFVVGPALISADLRNNALPLYLARPFSRVEYILGKSTVLMVLLSAITWVPGLLLFFLHAYLMGWNWFSEHYRIGVAIFLSSWITIAVLCLISLAISAYVRWKPLARFALFGVFFATASIGGMVNFMLKTDRGSLLNITEMIRVVWISLFGLERIVPVPAVAAWTSLLVVCGACLLLLARKVRAYEVVK